MEEDFPDGYCPVCNEDIYGRYNSHRCNPKKLAGINAANTRASDDIDAFRNLTSPSLDEMLALGFAMLEGRDGYDLKMR